MNSHFHGLDIVTIKADKHRRWYYEDELGRRVKVQAPDLAPSVRRPARLAKGPSKRTVDQALKLKRAKESGLGAVDPVLRRRYDFFRRQRMGGVRGESARHALRFARVEQRAQDEGWCTWWEYDNDYQPMDDAERAWLAANPDVTPMCVGAFPPSGCDEDGEPVDRSDGFWLCGILIPLDNAEARAQEREFEAQMLDKAMRYHDGSPSTGGEADVATASMLIEEGQRLFGLSRSQYIRGRKALRDGDCTRALAALRQADRMYGGIGALAHVDGAEPNEALVPLRLKLRVAADKNWAMYERRCAPKAHVGPARPKRRRRTGLLEF